MKCVSCKESEMKKVKSAYFADLGACYDIIENEPCYKCEKCGEVFYTASVAERLEEIIEHVQTVASKIFICDYANVA